MMPMIALRCFAAAAMMLAHVLRATMLFQRTVSRGHTLMLTFRRRVFATYYFHRRHADFACRHAPIDDCELCGFSSFRRFSRYAVMMRVIIERKERRRAFYADMRADAARHTRACLRHAMRVSALHERAMPRYARSRAVTMMF